MAVVLERPIRLHQVVMSRTRLFITLLLESLRQKDCRYLVYFLSSLFDCLMLSPNYGHIASSLRKQLLDVSLGL